MIPHPYFMMAHVKNLLSLFLAIVFVCTGILLLIQIGLPDRADFTGYTIKDIGYVAPELDHVAPPFVLSTTNFDPFDLNDLNDEAIIINFWATWCVPCRTEMPELQSLYERYEGNIHILGVNLGENPEPVAQWVNELNLTFDILLDPLQSVAQLYQIRGQPTTYILDSEHIIRYIHYGPVHMEELEANLESIFQR